jgi:transcription-repair coupling factor (superfamily II helicase)
MAEALTKAYAARKALPGFAFKPDSVWQREMEAAFPLRGNCPISCVRSRK